MVCKNMPILSYSVHAATVDNSSHEFTPWYASSFLLSCPSSRPLIRGRQTGQTVVSHVTCQLALSAGLPSGGVWRRSGSMVEFASLQFAVLHQPPLADCSHYPSIPSITPPPTRSAVEFITMATSTTPGSGKSAVLFLVPSRVPGRLVACCLFPSRAPGRDRDSFQPRNSSCCLVINTSVSCAGFHPTRLASP